MVADGTRQSLFEARRCYRLPILSQDRCPASYQYYVMAARFSVLLLCTSRRRSTDYAEELGWKRVLNSFLDQDL